MWRARSFRIDPDQRVGGRSPCEGPGHPAGSLPRTPALCRRRGRGAGRGLAGRGNGVGPGGPGHRRRSVRNVTNVPGPRASVTKVRSRRSFVTHLGGGGAWVTFFSGPGPAPPAERDPGLRLPPLPAQPRHAPRPRGRQNETARAATSAVVARYGRRVRSPGQRHAPPGSRGARGVRGPDERRTPRTLGRRRGSWRLRPLRPNHVGAALPPLAGPNRPAPRALPPTSSTTLRAALTARGRPQPPGPRPLPPTGLTTPRSDDLHSRKTATAGPAAGAPIYRPTTLGPCPAPAADRDRPRPGSPPARETEALGAGCRRHRPGRATRSARARESEGSRRTPTAPGRPPPSGARSRSVARLSDAATRRLRPRRGRRGRTGRCSRGGRP